MTPFLQLSFSNDTPWSGLTNQSSNAFLPQNLSPMTPPWYKEFFSQNTLVFSLNSKWMNQSSNAFLPQNLSPMTPPPDTRNFSVKILWFSPSIPNEWIRGTMPFCLKNFSPMAPPAQSPKAGSGFPEWRLMNQRRNAFWPQFLLPMTPPRRNHQKPGVVTSNEAW